MSNFFHGWRRKAGCVLLVMAAAFMGGWIRSRAVEDRLDIPLSRCVYRFRSHNGQIDWSRMWMVNDDLGQQWSQTWKTSRIVNPNAAGLKLFSTSRGWFFRVANVRVEIHTLSVAYWLTVIPLTLLSAYLILWPGKRPDRKISPPE